jgi:broad specificity phosphatase PhoE
LAVSIFLIRHAAHEDLGRTLSGRLPDLPLSDAGIEQARRLAARLADLRFAAIQSSPVQRARETAARIASACGVPAEIAERLDEIDFGAWTGKTFVELERELGWSDWNSERGSARAADGETMEQAQARIVGHIQHLSARYEGSAVALVSHCDLIRAALAYYLRLPLDHILTFDVDPASVSRLTVGDWGGRVQSVNETLQ